MNESQWDVPRTDEGMALLLGRLHESNAVGDELEVAHGLVALSWLCRWVRIPDVKDSFMRFTGIAQQALDIYRRLENRPGIVRAILSGHTWQPNANEMLDEAEAIARELGDDSLVAQVLAAKGRRAGPDAVGLTQEALEMFESLADVRRQAMCHLSLSIKHVGPNQKTERRAHALRGFALYASIGDNTQWKCLKMAIWNNETPENWLEMEPLFREALAYAAETGERFQEWDGYTGLAHCYEYRNEEPEAATYRRWESEIHATLWPGVTDTRREELARLGWMISQAERRGDAAAVASLTLEREAVRVRKMKYERMPTRVTPLMRRGGGRKLRKYVPSASSR